MKRIICLLLIGVCLMLVMGSLLAQEEGQSPTSTAPLTPEGGKKSGGMTFWEIIKAGGITMIFIALCSIAALAITIERFINTKTKKLIPQDLIEEINTLTKEKRIEEAGALCEKRPCLVSNIFKEALEKISHGHKAVLQAIEEAGAKESAMMQQRIIYLSVIATVAPMIGLLGTVLGMIQSFNVIAFQGGAGKPTMMAAGIAKALVTTAFGLIVAIPAMVAFYYFKNGIQNLMARVENIMEDFIDIIYPAGPGQPE